MYAVDVVNGEFVQVLPTGGNQWVCLSSIGCSKGHVNLYYGLFHDVICDDIKQQARDLLGNEFRKLSAVLVQQQFNGSDCGVFSKAYATSLVFLDDPKIIQYDIPKMRWAPDKMFKGWSNGAIYCHSASLETKLRIVLVIPINVNPSASV